MRIRPRQGGFASDDAGQSVVIVALAFTLLLGFTGLAIDASRYYAERRFLQTAVDAAALACAQKLIAGGTTTAAEAQGRTILTTYNLQSDPTGTGITVSTTPQYNGWFNADPLDKRNLYDGIYASSTSCRVAVEAVMRTAFMQLLGIRSLSVPANAHASAKGGMLPVVVNRYRDPPGPSSTFIDHVKQEGYQLANPNVCSENGGGNCPDAADTDVSCTSGCLWGPETVIAGQGYTSSDSDFRGFIALDVRDFSTSATGANLYYNGTSGMNANQLKAQEASYLAGGYPGPDLEAFIPNSDPLQRGLQIATMSGNSAGIVVSNFQKYYRVGDKILVQLFDGQVREIPDFTINPPSTISATAGAPAGNGPTFRVGANQRFRDNSCTTSPVGPCWVDLAMVRDAFNNGASNDTPSGLSEFTFNPDNFTPSGGAGTQVTIQNVQVDGLTAAGIYSVIVQGEGHYQPNPGGGLTSRKQAHVPLNVNGVTRDFAMNFDATTVDVDSGTNAVYTFTLTTGSSTQAWGSTPVTVAIDRGTCVLGEVAIFEAGNPVPFCVSATITANPDFVPRRTGPPTVTVTIPTGALASPRTYSLVLRARGLNQDGQPVVHVQPLTLNVGTTPGTAQKYVNVQGYSVFVITSITANAVLGRAIRGYHANPNDSALSVGRKAGLIPWEAAPY
jgi:Flp pilus assembly protein TadG